MSATLDTIVRTDDNAYMTAKDVRALRAYLGLTQEEFAELLDCSRLAVSQWERGLRKPIMVFRLRMLEIAKKSVESR